MKNLISRNFTQVPNELINDKNLHPVARFLFIYLCSKPEDWEYYNSELCAATRLSEETLRKYMKELAVAGWITKEQKKNISGEWGSNDIVLHPSPNFPETVVLPEPEFTVPVKTGTGKSPGHSNTNYYNNTELFNNTEIPSIPLQILDYLNSKKVGKNFSDTASNLKDIKTRLKEKYVMADFEKVIDAAILKWGNDKKMKAYIRPVTLFGNKFDSYLTEADDVIAGLASGADTSANNFEEFEATEANLK